MAEACGVRGALICRRSGSSLCGLIFASVSFHGCCFISYDHSSFRPVCQCLISTISSYIPDPRALLMALRSCVPGAIGLSLPLSLSLSLSMPPSRCHVPVWALLACICYPDPVFGLVLALCSFACTLGSLALGR